MKLLLVLFSFVIGSVPLIATEAMFINIFFDNYTGGSIEYKIKLSGKDNRVLEFVPEIGELVCIEIDHEGNEEEKVSLDLDKKKCDELLKYIQESEIMNLSEEMEFGSIRAAFIMDGGGASIEIKYKDYNKKVKRFQASVSMPMELLLGFMEGFMKGLMVQPAAGGDGTR